MKYRFNVIKALFAEGVKIMLSWPDLRAITKKKQGKMNYREEQLKRLDAQIEWNQFLIAAARSPLTAAIPYLKTMLAALRRQTLMGRILLEGGEKALNNPPMAERAVHAAGFARPWDAVTWMESGRSVYAAWRRAKAVGDYSLMVEAADRRYALAREIGTRRMQEFNRLAGLHGWQPLARVSESFIQRQSPGLNSVKVDSMTEDLAFWAPLRRSYVKGWLARYQTIPRAALDQITADDKMMLARRLLDKDPDGLMSVTLRETQSPLCQGYGGKVGIGLNPQAPFFVFLKSYRHERAHAAYRTHLKGAPPSAALDELVPLADEHFLLPSLSECRKILEELQWVMGDRFPAALSADHIRQGFASIEDADMGPDPDFMIYAINRAIYNRAEARMLDEGIPMAQFPDILAEHVWMFTGETITRDQAEKMALERFQPYFTPGRGKAYEAAIYAAAALAGKLKPLTPEARRHWLHQNLYALPDTPGFMEAVEKLTGDKLSARGLEGQAVALSF